MEGLQGILLGICAVGGWILCIDYKDKRGILVIIAALAVFLTGCATGR